MRQSWTREEIDLLIKNYDNPKEVLLKLFPNRTWSSINHKIQRLRLDRTKWMCKKPVLSKEELKSLLDKGHTPKEIATQVGVTPQYINYLMRKYKLKRYRSRYTVPNYNEVERRLIALSIDWEGSIMIEKRFDKRIQKFQLLPRVNIANTKRELIEYFKSLTRTGSITIAHRSNPNHKDTYYWFLTGVKPVKDFLEQIKDYLIGKKEVCNAVLEFCNLRMKRYGKPYSERELQLYEKVRLLNKRGR